MIKRSAEANRRRWHSRTLWAQQGSDSVFISHSDLPSTPRPASVSASLPPAATDWPLWDIYTHVTGLYLHNTHNTQPAATFRTRQVPQSGETHFWHDFSDVQLPANTLKITEDDIHGRIFWFLSSTSVNWISYFRKHRSPFFKNSSIIWKTTDRLFNHENNRPPLDVQTDVVNRTLTRSAVNVLWLGNKMTKERLINFPLVISTPLQYGLRLDQGAGWCVSWWMPSRATRLDPFQPPLLSSSSSPNSGRQPPLPEGATAVAMATRADNTSR